MRTNSIADLCSIPEKILKQYEKNFEYFFPWEKINLHQNILLHQDIHQR